MKKHILIVTSIISLIFTAVSQLPAQTTTPNVSGLLVPQPVPDRSLMFRLSDTGTAKPINWGLDLAWLSEDNVRRGVAFMGVNNVDIIRSSFTPTAALVNNDLAATELSRLNQRINIINTWVGKNSKVALNCDHPSVDASFKGNAANWAQLIDVTTRRHQEAGHTVITVSPFNEPDYTATGQGNVTDFYNIAALLKQNPRFSNIRISGGNTLNTDQALSWYNQLKTNLDEGNTHQLAGSFDNYANFFSTVRANGHHATNDELHNVMEAMVGVEYGLQTGIWWGTAEYARGEFVKASDGQRLAYAEHRPNWTSAAVYRHPEGKLQAFGGTSERQAVTTTYRFVSKEKSVYFDGQGPTREYLMSLPGGTGYQNGQTNAEKVVNITYGEDIQPVINGTYIVVNRASGKVMEVASGSTAAGANVRQRTYGGFNYQQWKVNPVDSRIGGDFSYFSFIATHGTKAMDLLNWSLSNGGNIHMWDDAKGGNQQWYLEYVEDGWFYIRSRHSAKCVEVVGSSTLDNANIQQNDVKGTFNQQWRFIPTDATVEFTPPAAPANLTTTVRSVSVQLDWSAVEAADLAGYDIYRSETSAGSYETIARNVQGTTFIDNSVTDTITYYYAVKATDKSLNKSPFSNQIAAKPTGNKDAVLRLEMEGNTADSTIHLNHGATSGTILYTTGKTGSKAITLNGSNSFVQLPYTIAHSREMTIALWVYWRGGNNWQRILDFGNDQNEYMFLSPRTATGHLRFAIKNGGTEQMLNAAALSSYKWTHVAITLGADSAKMYVDGKQVAGSASLTIRPADFKPVLNYLGRSQFADPLFYGSLDDVRIYNRALTGTEIQHIVNGEPSAVAEVTTTQNKLKIWPVPAHETLHVNYSPTSYNPAAQLQLFNSNGQQVVSRQFETGTTTALPIAGLPEGIYLLQVISEGERAVQRVVVKK